MHELRTQLAGLNPDILFLQEVQGAHSRHAMRISNWPALPQHEFLAAELGLEVAYGGNAIYDHGHHGNAIVSRFPIVRSENTDVSSHAFERRGLLHCEIRIAGIEEIVHCLCVHLGLDERGRQGQASTLIGQINAAVPRGAPLIVAGDFNDWRNRVGARMVRELGVTDVFRDERGRPPRSYPSALPMLRLDRIYVRGFQVQHVAVHHGPPWSRLSDHAALSAQITIG